MNRKFICILLLIAVLAASNAFGKDETGYYQQVRSCFGLAAGSPAGLNLFLGNYSARGFGWRVSGAYIPGTRGRRMAGIQFNVLYRIHETQYALVDVSVITGYSEFRRAQDNKTWRYSGIALALRWKAFFVETGITTGRGSYNNPQPGLQVGVVLRTERRRH